MGLIFGALSFCALISVIWGKKTAQAWANGIFNFFLFIGVCIVALMWYFAFLMDKMPATSTPGSSYQAYTPPASAPVYETATPAATTPFSSSTSAGELLSQPVPSMAALDSFPRLAIG